MEILSFHKKLVIFSIMKLYYYYKLNCKNDNVF